MRVTFPCDCVQSPTSKQCFQKKFCDFAQMKATRSIIQMYNAIRYICKDFKMGYAFQLREYQSEEDFSTKILSEVPEDSTSLSCCIINTFDISGTNTLYYQFVH